MITPLLLLSDYNARFKAGSGEYTTAQNAAYRDIIVQASEQLQAECGRRFDERIETRYYSAVPVRYSGDIDGANLWLDDDLKSVTTIVNGDGTTISTGYTLMPRRPEYSYTHIRLDPYGTVYWTANTLDPYESIAITGVWGYGGEWVSLTTLTEELADDATTAAIADSNIYEIGMMLKIGTEYLLVTTVDSDAITVTRAQNGSTAATHASATAVYYWRAMPSVRQLVLRLMAWRLQQDKSPLVGQVVAGDFQFPVNVATMPQDVVAGIRTMGLKRAGRIYGI